MKNTKNSVKGKGVPDQQRSTASPFEIDFEESEINNTLPFQQRPTRMCRNFKRGNCKFGSSCKFRHQNKYNGPIRTGPSSGTLLVTDVRKPDAPNEEKSSAAKGNRNNCRNRQKDFVTSCTNQDVRKKDRNVEETTRKIKLSTESEKSNKKVRDTRLHSGKPQTEMPVTEGPSVNGTQQSHSENVEDEKPRPEVQLYHPGKVRLDWAEVRNVGAGLANLGNTCFLNAVLQCLTYCPPLVNYLLQGEHSADCKISEFCMTCVLEAHIREAFRQFDDVIEPFGICLYLSDIAGHFEFGKQEDAHEFLRFVIDGLWKSSIPSHRNNKLEAASSETSVINDIFGGYNRSQIVCFGCNSTSDTYENSMDFILDIQEAHSLESALEQAVNPELLENENAYKCSLCDAHVLAAKTFTIHRPPNVATFQFKRFEYYKSHEKKTKRVSYPEIFDIRPYMSQSEGDSILYRLHAVLVHMGDSGEHGHYYCYVRNSDCTWYLMDDAVVREVSLLEVLDQEAYVLFYIRSC